MVKANLSSLAIGNPQFSYEFALFKPISLSIGYGTLLSDKLPSASITKMNLNESPIIDVWEYTNANLQEFVFEIRTYLGKGYGKGLYTGVFYQTALLDVKEFPFRIASDFVLNGFGNIVSNSYGILLGAQFNLGKHLVLDVFINPKYSIIDGNIAAFTNNEWSGSSSVQDIAYTPGFYDETIVPLGGGEFGSQPRVSFVRTGSSAYIFGSFIDIRAGINLGFRF